MGLFSMLFGSKDAETPEQIAARQEQRQFDTLRDNGVRALQMGEARLALQQLSEAHHLRPADIRVSELLAEVHLRLQNFGEALPLLRTLLEAEPENLEVALLLADAQGRTGDFDGMASTVQPLFEAHADDARPAYFMGVAAHGQGNDLMAVAHLTQALALRDDYSRARRLRAEVLGAMGQWGEALEDVEVLLGGPLAEATAADPFTEEVMTLRGRALAALGRSDEADVAFERVLEGNPFSRTAILARAEALDAAGHADRALAVLGGAIEQMPDFAQAYHARGAIRHRLHDEAGALEDIRKALEASPEFVKNFDGEFANIQNKLADYYRSLNPYQF